MELVSFTVMGKAVPAGSKNAHAIYRGKRGAKVFTGKVAVVDSSGEKGREWRKNIQITAIDAMGRAFIPLIEDPILLEVMIQEKRPKSHYRTGKFAHLLKENVPLHNVSKPDLTKLIRAIEDALNGIAWRDDSQIVSQHCIKKYGPDDRVYIRISKIGGNG